jgi:ElaB/YqjD/DUF883 family membrane-anchored ribosome-binding protein
MATKVGEPGPVTPAAAETVAKAADEAIRAVEAKADSLGDEIRAVAGDVREHTSGVREQASKLADEAIEQARSAASEGKARAAQALSGVASAAREAADKLSDNPNAAPVGKFATQAADAIERFAGNLRDRDVDQLVDDVVGYVKRNPAIAVGAAVAVGFAIARLLRGSGSGGERDPYADLGDDDGAWRG